MEDMGLEQEWLSFACRGESTKSAYKKGLHYFLKFVNLKRAEDLKTLEKPELRIVQFFDWLQSPEFRKAYPNKNGKPKPPLNENSARARCVPVQSLFNYMGIKLNLKGKLPEIGPKPELWRPSVEELQKIFASNDLPVKAWMSLSRDVPARMGDMLTITNEQIQRGEFDLLSKKEKVMGRCYVSEQTQKLFKQLEESGLKLPATARGIGIMMTKACQVCGLPVLNQHLWRKIFSSKCLDLGISETSWKFLSFKKVHSSDATYFLNSSTLREQWQKVVNALPLVPSNGNGRMTNVEEALDLVMKCLRKMVEREMGLTKRVSEITDKEALMEYLEGAKE